MQKSPFKLLASYGSGEKDIFFGRDAEIIALYHLLKQTKLALVYGASGTGKTSLIQAGLPKVFKVADWLPIFIRRRTNINQSFQEALNRSLGDVETTNNFIEDIKSIYETRWMPIYLVFDQFEEIFTLGEEQEREQFFQSLQLILDSNLSCKVILSMREEYIGHLYEYEPMVPTLFHKRFRVEPMKDVTVKEVIKKMCAKYGIKLENGLDTIEQIFEQIKFGKQPVYLPYLQIYLHYLYEYSIEHYKKKEFGAEGIRAIGELGNVLKQFIEHKTAEGQEYLNQYKLPENFAALLLDEFATNAGTKQSHLKATLAKKLRVEEDLIEKALIYFSNTAKLLKVDENEVDRYEPIHDVVAKQIHELRSAEDIEYKDFEKKLEQDYERWRQNPTSTDLLLHQTDLNRAQVFQKKLQNKENYTSAYIVFIDKSESFLKRKERIRKLRNFFLMVLTITAIIASIYALIQQNAAEESFENFKEKQAELAIGEVEDIQKRAQAISKDYRTIANQMIQTAIERLQQEEYNNNEDIQDKLKELEQLSF